MKMKAPCHQLYSKNKLRVDLVPMIWRDVLMPLTIPSAAKKELQHSFEAMEYLVHFISVL